MLRQMTNGRTQFVVTELPFRILLLQLRAHCGPIDENFFSDVVFFEFQEELLDPFKRACRNGRRHLVPRNLLSYPLKQTIDSVAGERACTNESSANSTVAAESFDFRVRQRCITYITPCSDQDSTT